MADISAGSRSPDAICFHAHQAAEKLLKAALIRHHIPPPRTHRLSEVLRRCVADLRDDPRMVRACALLEVLWPNMRYPDQPAPTLGEADAAMAAAYEVQGAVMHHMDAP